MSAETGSAPRESQVRAAQVKLEQAIDRADKAGQCLFARIENVTKPSVPQPPVSEQVIAKDDFVQLAGWINDKAKRVQCIAQAIEDTKCRVEL